MNERSFEQLESRLFLSATPAGVFNATVKADRLAVKASLLHFTSDALSGTAKLIVDTVTIKKNIPAGDTSLSASVQQLKTDNKALATQLHLDRLTESAQSLSDEATIKLDLAQIIRDKADVTALATDKAKLHTDRAQLQTDLIAGINQRIADRTAAEATISADTQAIVTAADNDLNASDTLKAAVTKFATDRTAKLATLTADLAGVAAARTQLASDLAAEATA